MAVRLLNFELRNFFFKELVECLMVRAAFANDQLEQISNLFLWMAKLKSFTRNK